ncbi:cell adhesion molecule 2 isoform X1 [Octopus sinensis]|uniref:Cell adhesion molecule 2 isoform X1 n=1 Tax=Octopus sinensis TaxID=2607531 RepID=A0A7E6F8Q7_9MOLL|nr:cell adhesion molecule 2 isoform X1 [Octopus sinensis]
MIVLSLEDTVLGSLYAMTSTPPMPSFLPTPTNVTFLRGELATLRCAVINLGTKFVIWRKASDPNPLTVSEELYVEDSTYSVHRVPSAHEWNLQIKNVQCKHNGVYECQVSSKDTIRKHVYLLVIDKPRNDPAITISGKSYVDKDLAIRLTCNASGLSHPHVADWFKDGQKINANKIKQISITGSSSYETGTISSTLVIKHSKLTDQGTYICRTSESLVTSMKVNVLDAQKTTQGV